MVLLFLHTLVTQNQVHQVFFLSTCVDGDTVEQQVLAQVPDSEVHEPGTLEGCGLQQMTGGTNTLVSLQQGAKGAKGPFTVTADVLSTEG